MIRFTDTDAMTPADARAALDALTTYFDPDCDLHLDAINALIDCDDLLNAELDSPLADTIRALVDRICDDRETLTNTMLDRSLCPLHMRDYAICFDDDDPECAAIRSIHPTHDT